MTEFEELAKAYKSYRNNRMMERAYLCVERLYSIDADKAKPYLKDLRDSLVWLVQEEHSVEAYDVSRRSYFLDAKDNFDSYMIAMEWDRSPNARFWLPRRKILEQKFGVCSTIQNFIFDPCSHKLALSTPPGCGKSTLIKFLCTFIMGNWPKSMNMYISYSDGMVKMMMDAILSLTCDDEYNFNEIFGIGKPTDISKEYNTIGYKRKGDAQTFNMCSIGGSVTGRTRANKFIITDDLVKNDEVARSPERLNTLYDDYTNTLMTRTIGSGWKEIQLGTIWSIYDPISREKLKHEGKKGYYFIGLPVCDDLGHSNFEYDCADNYTDEKIAELKEKLDPVVFSCLYLQRGIQKEGMPFTHDKLQFYDGTLPSGDPDSVIAFCDVAWGGGDSLSMPIGYVYGSDMFIHDVVFTRADKTVSQPMVVNALVKNGVQKVRFEANVGGTEYADSISELLKKIPYSCNVTSKRAPNTTSKMGKIEQYQQDIRNMYFRRDSVSDAYKLFLNEVEVFSFTQKNLHDDAVDSLAGLADLKVNGVSRLKLGSRLW